MDPRREQRELATGAHIVVGTPGRLCDHLRRGKLDVSSLKAIVLDEADEMLDLGFREDIEFILQATPESRRTLLFSATLPRGIVTLAKEYQDDAFRIEVMGEEGGHADIEYRAIRVAAGDAEHAIVNLLRFFEAPGALVFCNTREAVRHLQATLLERGFSVVALSGELTQNERTQALQALRDGRARICVATDVAARGIDLPKLDLVIHADLPNDPEVMQHRSGRTGRAGRKGVSILLVPSARRRRADMLLKLAGIDAAWGIAPQPDEIRKLDQERLLKDDVFAADATSEDQALAQALLTERSAEEVAIALARLYRARLPSPEDIADPGENRVKSRAERARERAERESKPGKSAGRHRMAEDSVWFTAAIGRRNNAEARWLLPMLCRRGSIKKEELGTIRILDTATEFEVAARVARRFAARIRRPDKQDSIRIEAMTAVPGHDEFRQRNDRPKPYGKSGKEADSAAFDKKARYDTKRRHRDEPAPAGKPRHESPAPAKAAFERTNKKFRG
jgi:ATP-dependent RNA helicase DeaD